jgi:hypothetical protein
MSWEAHRLTSKSPAEVYTVLGPHGCDDLIRQAWAACWREHPEETRTFKAVRQRFFETFTRNLNIWRRIKKPTPEAFFADLKPHDTVEGHLRQAMVLAWMMLPRAGGRTFADTIPLIQRLYDRNLAAFEEDNQTFTKGPQKRKRPTRSAKAKKKTQKKSRKK